MLGVADFVKSWKHALSDPLVRHDSAWQAHAHAAYMLSCARADKLGQEVCEAESRAAPVQITARKGGVLLAGGQVLHSGAVLHTHVAPTAQCHIKASCHAITCASTRALYHSCVCTENGSCGQGNACLPWAALCHVTAALPCAV